MTQTNKPGAWQEAYLGERDDDGLPLAPVKRDRGRPPKPRDQLSPAYRKRLEARRPVVVEPAREPPPKGAVVDGTKPYWPELAALPGPCWAVCRDCGRAWDRSMMVWLEVHSTGRCCKCNRKLGES